MRTALSLNLIRATQCNQPAPTRLAGCRSVIFRRLRRPSIMKSSRFVILGINQQQYCCSAVWLACISLRQTVGLFWEITGMGVIFIFVFARWRHRGLWPLWVLQCSTPVSRLVRKKERRFTVFQHNVVTVVFVFFVHFRLYDRCYTVDRHDRHHGSIPGSILRRQSHLRSGLATLPSVGAIP